MSLALSPLLFISLSRAHTHTHTHAHMHINTRGGDTLFPRRKGEEWGEGLSFAITAMFCLEFAYVFRFLVSIRKVASEHLLCVLIYMNSCIFQIDFILIVFL